MRISKVAIRYFRNSPKSNWIQTALKVTLYPVTFIRNNLIGPKILDVGCGEGILLNLIGLESNLEFLGIDIDMKKIIIASKCANSSNIEFSNVNLFEVSKGEKFNTLILNDFLHHFSHTNQLEIIQKLSDIISDNGLVVLKEVGNLRSFDYFFTSRIDKKLYPQDKLLFRESRTWVKLFSEFGWKLIAQRVSKHIWPSCRHLLIFRKIN